MTSIYFNRFCRALVLLAALPGFSANAQPSLVFTTTVPAAMTQRPSIIFIQCDGLGYGDLSCYGQKKFQTPNLDKLAAEGIRFANYSAAADSPSSQAELMTGNISAQPLPLAPDEITVAQVLKNSGYHTGLIGEWDLGDENSGGAPWKKGFDEFAGYFDPDDAENFYAGYIFHYAPKSLLNETNRQMEDYIGREMLYFNTGGKHETYIPDLYAKAALNFVQNNLPDQFNNYRPFFLLLNYKIPGGGKIEVPTDAPFSDEKWPQSEKNRAALITRLDGYVGQLVEQLGKLGMTNNAAVFFSGAASSNELRAPMIARWPGKIPAGQASDYKWSPQDFLPTAAQIAFAQSPTNIDGISVMPVLLGRAKK